MILKTTSSPSVPVRNDLRESCLSSLNRTSARPIRAGADRKYHFEEFSVKVRTWFFSQSGPVFEMRVGDDCQIGRVILSVSFI